MHMRLLIELNNLEEAPFIKRLLNRLNVSIISEESGLQGSQTVALQSLQQIARRGGLSSIPDPQAWQREQRQDRELPFS